VLQNVVRISDMLTTQQQQLAALLKNLDTVEGQTNRLDNTVNGYLDIYRESIEQGMKLKKMREVCGSLGAELDLGLAGQLVDSWMPHAEKLLASSAGVQESVESVCGVAAGNLQVLQSMSKLVGELHAGDPLSMVPLDEQGLSELAAAMRRAEELMSADGACGKLRAVAGTMAKAEYVQRMLIDQINQMPRPLGAVLAPPSEACSNNDEAVAEREQPAAPPVASALLAPLAPSEVATTADNEEQQAEITRTPVAKTGAATEVCLLLCPLFHLLHAL